MTALAVLPFSAFRKASSRGFSTSQMSYPVSGTLKAALPSWAVRSAWTVNPSQVGVKPSLKIAWRIVSTSRRVPGLVVKEEFIVAIENLVAAKKGSDPLSRIELLKTPGVHSMRISN